MPDCSYGVQILGILFSFDSLVGKVGNSDACFEELMLGGLKSSPIPMNNDETQDQEEEEDKLGRW